MKKAQKKLKQNVFTKEEIGEYNPVPFSEIRKEWMKDPAFLEAKKKSAPEYVLIRQIIEGRIKRNISQKMLAKRLGTGQSAVSRLESGTYNPTFTFVKKLARALETDLTVTFSK